jgi:hypothetical protein
VQKLGLPGVRSACNDLERSMIVAMIAVRMVQVSVDKVIDVIAMRHRLMSASGAMHMPRLVAAAAVIRGALVGIFRTHLDRMLIHVIAVRMMEMAIMQIIDVIAVANGCVATAGAMLMVVICMVRETATVHRSAPFQSCWGPELLGPVASPPRSRETGCKGASAERPVPGEGFEPRPSQNRGTTAVENSRQSFDFAATDQMLGRCPETVLTLLCTTATRSKIHASPHPGKACGGIPELLDHRLT